MEKTEDCSVTYLADEEQVEVVPAVILSPEAVHHARDRDAKEKGKVVH